MRWIHDKRKGRKGGRGRGEERIWGREIVFKIVIDYASLISFLLILTMKPFTRFGKKPHFCFKKIQKLAYSKIEIRFFPNVTAPDP